MQNYIRRVGLLAAFMAMAGASRAQVFRPGLLVLASGDTLRGEVEDNAWEEAPRQLRFRPAAGAAITSYPATALRAVAMTNGRYFRHELLPLDRSARTWLESLPSSPAHHQQTEALLAEVVVAGPATLLKTRVEEVWHYFVQRAGQPYLELTERQYLRTVGERRVVMDANNYQAELSTYFADCPAAAQAAGAAAFTPAGLRAVVQAYNQACAHQAGVEYPPRAAKTSQPAGINLGLVAGGRYSSFRLRAHESPGLEAPALDGVNEDGQVHPVGGAYADVLFSGRRLALHAAVLVSTFGRNGATPANAAGEPGYLEARGTLTEIRLGMRFFWPVGRLRTQLFVGTGLTIPERWGDVERSSDAQVRCGAGPTRTVAGLGTLYTQSWLPEATPVGGTPLPYLEAGLRQGRLTVALDGRWLPGNSFQNELAVRTIYNKGTLLNDYTSYTYSYRRWYVSATLGVSLFARR